MAAMMIGSCEESKNGLTMPNPSEMPKKTAQPPSTGTGLRCSLRKSGLSTIPLR